MLRYYDFLADKSLHGEEKSISTLLKLSRYDERAIHKITSHKLLPILLKDLEDYNKSEEHKCDIVEAFRKIIFYDAEGGDFLLINFSRICSILSRASGVPLKVSTAELISNSARVQPYRSVLFNYSESFRHLVFEREPFHERAICACLAYIFCDDYMGDSVAKLQYKTDILNYVNNLFVRTLDLCAWRYSVRCLYLAGGFNEDKADVDKTRNLVFFANRFLPEFSLYFTVAYYYGKRRHRFVGLGEQHTPNWVVRRRSLVGAFFCGFLGLYSGAYQDWKMDKHRETFNEERNREMRKRRGYRGKNKKYVEKKKFDSIESITQSVYSKQIKIATVTWSLLLMSQYPLKFWRMPGWGKNIAFHFPSLPIIMPAPMGVPSPSNRMIPFIVVPYVSVKLFEWWVMGPTSLHDQFVRLRHWGSK